MCNQKEGALGRQDCRKVSKELNFPEETSSLLLEIMLIISNPEIVMPIIIRNDVKNSNKTYVLAGWL
jgi:hypothetical protein